MKKILKNSIKKLIEFKIIRRSIGTIIGTIKYLILKIKYKNLKEKYNISDHFHFNGEGIKIYGGGAIKVGKNSYIGSYSTIQLTEDTEVIIGNNCAISHNVRIYTSNREALDIINEEKEIRIKKGNVIIEDNCWIGANVFICQGIRIGKNSVIGANSVVSKDIPANSIAVGAPIKIIKTKSRD